MYRILYSSLMIMCDFILSHFLLYILYSLTSTPCGMVNTVQKKSITSPDLRIFALYYNTLLTNDIVNLNLKRIPIQAHPTKLSSPLLPTNSSALIPIYVINSSSFFQLSGRLCALMVSFQQSSLQRGCAFHK